MFLKLPIMLYGQIKEERTAEKTSIFIEHTQIAAYHAVYDNNLEPVLTQVFIKNNPMPITILVSIKEFDKMVREAIKLDLVSVPFPNLPSKQ